MRQVLLAMALPLMLAVALPCRAAEDGDPWQGLNRGVYGFNSAVDRILLKPVAKTYQAIVPRTLRLGVRNFFANIDDFDNAANNLLQGKVDHSASDLGRVLINTTLGVAGLFDLATHAGLRKHEEDFGQTLSVWGAPRGPYLVLPLLGPSTLTDAVARPVDSYMDPLRYYHPVDHRNGLMALRLIDLRAGLLAAEELISGDEYIFVRDAYQQRRDYLINDGRVSDPFADDF